MSGPDYEANLRELAREARRLGARHVVFLALPSLEGELDSPEARARMFGEGRELQAYRPDLDEHEKTLRRVGREEGLLLDLQADWKARGLLRPEFFLDRIHLTGPGIRQVCDDLAAFLESRGILAR